MRTDRQRIILASASPRRRELLALMGVRDFAVIPAREEEAPPADLGPAETVREIALMKARDVAAREPGLVIAADTLVWQDGALLGKPADGAEAAAMLRRLSGRKHTVFSGVAVLADGRELTDFEATDVWFREMSEEEIRFYVASGEPLDKAGAYGAQGLGSLFVRRIEGDFFNVMGLPVCRLGLMLKACGVDLASLNEG